MTLHDKTGFIKIQPGPVINGHPTVQVYDPQAEYFTTWTVAEFRACLWAKAEAGGDELRHQIEDAERLLPPGAAAP